MPRVRLALVGAVLGLVVVGGQTPLGTAFIYQGRLTDGGAPATGVYDFRVQLFDAALDGTLVGTPHTVFREDVAVATGAFALSLDFGGAAFGASKRWLEIGVRPGVSTGDFTVLQPRQEVTPTPAAMYASSAGSAQTVAAGAVGTAQIDPTQVQARVTGACAVGQYVRSIGPDGTVACGADASNAGTVTSVTAGAGLSGGTITGAGTIALADGGVTAAKIASGAVGAAQIDRSQVQARVQGFCPGGGSIWAITEEGHLGCIANTLPKAGFFVGTLDANAGHTSITIGTDGLGLISYLGRSDDEDLKVAHCNDIICSSATTATLDSAGRVGLYTSIAIGADGLGLISYYDLTKGDLKVAHCNDIVCSSATTATLDSTGDVGHDTSITIGADGLGLISYLAQLNNSDLRVAHCADLTCSHASPAPATLDRVGMTGWSTSITIGADFLGLISYFTFDGLKAAHCADVACSTTSGPPAIIDGPAGGGNASITIGADGLGLISYFDNKERDLKVAHCADLTCSTTSSPPATLDSVGQVGFNTSITIGADGLGLISYFDDTNDYLKVAHCANLACSTTSGPPAILDTLGGKDTSITIGADGLGLISYTAGGGLKVAHCSNALCQPFVRRR
jgi:hypothetical protein